MNLLVLRPAVGGAATVSRAAAAGYSALSAPLFVYRGVAWDMPDPDGIDGVLLTSAGAVRFGGDALSGYHDLPVHAVGSATADAAAAAGFTSVTAGTSNAAAAIATMAAQGHRTILHPAGLDHIAVRHPDVTILRRQVYAADAVDTLPTAAGQALDRGTIALLHSPRAADLFRCLLAKAGRPSRDVRIACFSPAIAAQAGTAWAGVAIADQPTDDALFAAITIMCDQGPDQAREQQ